MSESYEVVAGLGVGHERCEVGRVGHVSKKGTACAKRAALLECNVDRDRIREGTLVNRDRCVDRALDSSGVGVARDIGSERWADYKVCPGRQRDGRRSDDAEKELKRSSDEAG